MLNTNLNILSTLEQGSDSNQDPCRVGVLKV